MSLRFSGSAVGGTPAPTDAADDGPSPPWALGTIPAAPPALPAVDCWEAWERETAGKKYAWRCVFLMYLLKCCTHVHMLQDRCKDTIGHTLMH